MSNEMTQDELDEITKGELDDTNKPEPEESEITVKASVLEELMDKVSTLESRVNAQKSHSPRDESTTGRVMSAEVISAFLTEPRPGSELWDMNPFFWKNVFPGGEAITPHGDKRRLPPLILRFNTWSGPGSEFPNPAHLNRGISMGRALLHTHELVTVTEADIKEMNLPSSTRVKLGPENQAGEPLYPLKKVMAKLLADPECGREYMTGEEFQAQCNAWYTTLAHQKAQDTELKARLATIRKGREKISIPQSVLSAS